MFCGETLFRSTLITRLTMKLSFSIMVFSQLPSCRPIGSKIVVRFTLLTRSTNTTIR
jgi:hypothetical protein